MIRSSHEFIKPANSSLNKFVNSQRKENTNRNGQGWHQKGHKNLFWRIVESLRLGKNLTRAADRGTVAPLVLLRFLTQAGCLWPPLSREEFDRAQRDLKLRVGVWLSEVGLFFVLVFRWPVGRQLHSSASGISKTDRMFSPIDFLGVDGERAKLKQDECHPESFPKTCRNSKLVLLK